MTAFMPDAHTLLTVEQTVVGGRPAPKAACRAGACAPHTRTHFIHLYYTVWVVEPVVTHQTSWHESTGVCGV